MAKKMVAVKKSAPMPFQPKEAKAAKVTVKGKKK